MNGDIDAPRLARATAWLVLRLRWPIVVAWIAGAIAASVLLPSLEDASGLPASSLVPRDAESLAVARRSAELFEVPAPTGTAVVQRDPEGLSSEVQRRVADRALGVLERRDPELEGLEFALPLTNVQFLVPASRETSTTAITYLVIRPEISLSDQNDLAERFVDKYVTEPDDALIGVTGTIPARLQEWREMTSGLPWVTAAAILAIALILGLYYRAVIAPAVVLAAAGIAYLVAKHVVAWGGTLLDRPVPRDVEPVLVALLLGVVTDYAVFFLTGMRRRLLAGEPRLAAAQRSTAEFLPIVTTAGLIVAAGSASLVVGTLSFFRSLGPGLAIGVLISLLVAVTFVPALMGIFGRLLFWPSFEAARERHARDEALSEARSAFWFALTRVATSRPIALVVTLACLVALAVACRGLLEVNLGVTAVRGLPEGSEARRAADAAGQGFAPGILSPTVVLVEHPDGLAREDLERLEVEIETQPGVAGTIGPADEPARSVPGLVVNERADAARYFVVFADDPYGGAAIDDLETLRKRMPRLLESADLSGARVGFAGETAFAADTVRTIVGDLGRIAVAAVLANFLLLAIFLRALVAPAYLVLASGLALAASVGLTALVFQERLGYDELTYYVPVAVAVLLLSLGSDYNVFVVGRIWQEAERRPLRDALAFAAPRASGAITVAALALAASFAALALIPLRTFREFAFAMAVGVLIDAFLIRSLLVPALVSVFGEKSWWPSRRARREAA